MYLLIIIALQILLYSLPIFLLRILSLFQLISVFNLIAMVTICVVVIKLYLIRSVNVCFGFSSCDEVLNFIAEDQIIFS